MVYTGSEKRDKEEDKIFWKTEKKKIPINPLIFYTWLYLL